MVLKRIKQVATIIVSAILMIMVIAGCSTVKNSSEKTHAAADIEDSSVSIVAIENAKAGDFVHFGQYEQDNDLTNGKEKIAWRILIVENGKAFLLADKILDAKQYNVEKADVTWETCNLREWLNNDFYNTAFTSAEQAKIITSDVVNEDNPYFGTSGGNNTKDKVFILSFSDVINPGYGFSIDPGHSDPARQAQASAYAVSEGVLVITAEDDSEGVRSLYYGNSHWWLRAPGSTPQGTSAYYISYGGLVGNGGGVSDTFIGVRPALWMNL